MHSVRVPRFFTQWGITHRLAGFKTPFIRGFEHGKFRVCPEILKFYPQSVCLCFYWWSSWYVTHDSAILHEHWCVGWEDVSVIEAEVMSGIWNCSFAWRQKIQLALIGVPLKTCQILNHTIRHRVLTSITKLICAPGLRRDEQWIVENPWRKEGWWDRTISIGWRCTDERFDRGSA